MGRSRRMMMRKVIVFAVAVSLASAVMPHDDGANHEVNELTDATEVTSLRGLGEAVTEEISLGETNACKTSQCTAGNFLNNANAANCACEACAAGKFSASAGGTCADCVAGKFSAAGASSCTACAVGKWTFTEGSANCDGWDKHPGTRCKGQYPEGSETSGKGNGGANAPACHPKCMLQQNGTEAACATACGNNANCGGFVYVANPTRGKQCRFKKADCETKQMPANATSGVAFYKKGSRI